MTIEKEIQQAKQELVHLLEDMAKIKDQIARAKAHTAETGNYSDSNWFHAANRALKQKQIDHQKLQGRVSALNRRAGEEKIQESSQQTVTFERAFMRTAKMYLPPETYKALHKQTRLVVDAESEPRKEPPLTRCAAAKDGECSHSQCPQLRDGEPAKSGRHCPIDNWEED